MRPETITLIDSQTNIGPEYKKSLIEAGYEVAPISNGNGSDPQHPTDLALVSMPPNQNDRDLVKSLASQKEKPLFLFLLAEQKPEQATEAFQLGANDILQHPFTQNELLKRIETLSERRKRNNIGRPGKSVKGDLSDSSLHSIVDSFKEAKGTARLELSRGEQKGNIYFEDGKLYAATLDHFQDLEALLRLLRWKEGKFHITPTETNVPNELGVFAQEDPIAEALKQSKQWDQMMEKLPSFSQTLEVDYRRAQFESLDDLSHRLLWQLASHRTLDKVLNFFLEDNTIEALEALTRLYELKCYVPKDFPKEPPQQKPENPQALFSVKEPNLRKGIDAPREMGSFDNLLSSAAQEAAEFLMEAANAPSPQDSAGDSTLNFLGISSEEVSSSHRIASVDRQRAHSPSMEIFNIPLDEKSQKDSEPELTPPSKSAAAQTQDSIASSRNRRSDSTETSNANAFSNAVDVSEFISVETLNAIPESVVDEVITGGKIEAPPKSSDPHKFASVFGQEEISQISIEDKSSGAVHTEPDLDASALANFGAITSTASYDHDDLELKLPEDHNFLTQENLKESQEMPPLDEPIFKKTPTQEYDSLANIQVAVPDDADDEPLELGQPKAIVVTKGKKRDSKLTAGEINLGQLLESEASADLDQMLEDELISKTETAKDLQAIKDLEQPAVPNSPFIPKSQEELEAADAFLAQLAEDEEKGWNGQESNSVAQVAVEETAEKAEKKEEQFQFPTIDDDEISSALLKEARQGKDGELEIPTVRVESMDEIDVVKEAKGTIPYGSSPVAASFALEDEEGEIELQPASEKTYGDAIAEKSISEEFFFDTIPEPAVKQQESSPFKKFIFWVGSGILLGFLTFGGLKGFEMYKAQQAAKKNNKSEVNKLSKLKAPKRLPPIRRTKKAPERRGVSMVDPSAPPTERRKGVSMVDPAGGPDAKKQPDTRLTPPEGKGPDRRPAVRPVERRLQPPVRRRVKPVLRRVVKRRKPPRRRVVRRRKPPRRIVRRRKPPRRRVVRRKPPRRRASSSGKFRSLLSKAKRAKRRERFKSASRYAAQALKLQPRSIPALVIMGQALYERNKMSSALRYLQKAYRISPRRMGEGLVALGGIYYEKNKMSKARSVYKLYIKYYPRGKSSRDIRSILKTMR